MSKDGLLEIEENKWIPISIEKMKEEFAECKILCNGKIRGSETNRCTAPMTAKRRVRNGTYYCFTTCCIKEHPHADGCEHDRRSKTPTCSSYNRHATGYKKNDYLPSLLATRKHGTTGGDGGGSGKPFDNGEDPGASKDLDDVVQNVKTRVRTPSSLKSLVELLAYLTGEDLYMDHKVKDWIVDHRSFSYHYEKGMPEDWMIVVANRCAPEKLGLTVGLNEWILVDCTFDGGYRRKERHWIYRLKCDKKTLTKLKNRCNKKEDRDNYYVVVCAKWKKDPNIPNLFVSEKTTCRMVAFVKKENWENTNGVSNVG